MVAGLFPNYDRVRESDQQAFDGSGRIVSSRVTPTIPDPTRPAKFDATGGQPWRAPIGYFIACRCTPDIDTVRVSRLAGCGIETPVGSVPKLPQLLQKEEKNKVYNTRTRSSFWCTPGLDTSGMFKRIRASQNSNIPSCSSFQRYT